MCLVLARQVGVGVGLEFDSADYVNVARNLASGQPLLQHDQEVPYVAQFDADDGAAGLRPQSDNRSLSQ